MNNTSKRNLYFDDKNYEIIKHHNFFRGLSLVEIFSLCLVIGKEQGFRTPISRKKVIVRETTINNTNLPYLMMAIDVEETGNLEVINDKYAYFTICEEYAQTGILYLKEELYKNEYDLLDKMATEMLEYYNKNIIIRNMDDLNLKIKELYNTPNDAFEKLTYEERLNKLMEIKVYFDDLEDNPLYEEYISRINNEKNNKTRYNLQCTFLDKYLLNNQYLYGLYDVLIKTVYKFNLYVPNYMNKESKKLFKKAGYDTFSRDSISKVVEFDLNLRESLTVLTIALRLDYWGDSEDHDFHYLIGTNVITKLLNLISKNINEESIKEMEDYLSKS